MLIIARTPCKEHIAMAYNKNEPVRKIQSLKELSNDEKSALLELLRTHKKYGLVWEDKPEEVEERLRSELPVLKEVKERAIISDDPDAPNHILIEGDNLEALVALTYTHAGKIDVIYIDPPYNTRKRWASRHPLTLSAVSGSATALHRSNTANQTKNNRHDYQRDRGQDCTFQI